MKRNRKILILFISLSVITGGYILFERGKRKYHMKEIMKAYKEAYEKADSSDVKKDSL